MDLDIKYEFTGLGSLCYRKLTNFVVLDMLMLTVEHGQAAMRIPLLLKMNTIAT